MPFSFKLLKAQKSVVTWPVTLYSVGADPTVNSAIVSNCRFYNATGSSTTVDLKVTKGATTTTFAKLTVMPNSSALFGSEITLGPAEKLEASSSTTLDVVACGVERRP